MAILKTHRNGRPMMTLVKLTELYRTMASDIDFVEVLQTTEDYSQPDAYRALADVLEADQD